MAGGGMGGGSSGGASSGMNSAPSQPTMSNMQFNPYASGGMRSNPFGGRGNPFSGFGGFGGGFGGGMGGFQGGYGRPMGGPFGGSFQRGFGGFQRGMGGPMHMAMPYQQPSQSYEQLALHALPSRNDLTTTFEQKEYQRDEARLRNQMSQLPPSAMNMMQSNAMQQQRAPFNQSYDPNMGQQPSQGFGQQGLGSFASFLRGY